MPVAVAGVAEVPIGRDAELVWLDDLWELSRRGRRQIAMLRGDPGIGKTHLAAYWAGQAEQFGRVLWGDALPKGPYEPLTSALTSHLLRLPVDAQEWILGDQRQEMARLVPSLSRDGEPPQGHERDRGAERYRLFDAARHALARLCTVGPTILVLDNAHEIENDGLDLLKHVLASVDDAPFFILLLTRPYGGKPFENAVPAIRRDHFIHERVLYPLDEIPARALFRRLTGAEPSRNVLRQAKGIPVKLETLSVGPLDEAEEREPERAIVSRLDGRSRHLIEIAALGSAGLSASVLARAAGISVAEAIVSLREMDSLKLMSPATPDGDDPAAVTWQITHAVRRQAVLDLIEQPRARKLAKDLAEVLSREPKADHARLADLYELAESRGETRRHAFRAAEKAAGSRAYDTAVQYYRKTLVNTDSTTATAKRRCQLLNAIGSSLWNSGRFRDARASYAQAADLARVEKHTPELVKAALGRAGRTGFEGPTADAELVSTLKGALHRLGDADDHLRASVLAATAHAMTFSEAGSAEEARELAGQARSLAREQNDDRLLAEVLCTTSWAMWAPENLAARKATADEAVELADCLPDESLGIESRVFRITCDLESGDIESAQRDVEDCSRLAASVQSPYYVAAAATFQATFALLENVEEGERAVLRALALAQREHNPAVVRVWAVQIFYVHLMQDRLEELRTSTTSLAEYDAFIPAWRSGLAVIYAETGNLEDARAELDRAARDDFRGVARDMFWYITLDNYARVCVALADEKRAAALARLLGPFEERFVVAAGAGAVHGPVAMNLGLLAELRGDLPEALRLLRRAHERADAAQCRSAAAEACVEYVRLLVSQAVAGSLESTVRQVHRAVDVVETIASPRLASRLDATVTVATMLADAADDSSSATRLAKLRQRLALIPQPEAPPPRRRIQAVLPAGHGAIGRAAGDWNADVLERRLSRPAIQRGVLKAMEMLFQPDVAHPFRGTLVLHLTMSHLNDEPMIWSFQIGRTSAEHLAVEPDDPDLVVRLPAADFVGLLTGKVNGVHKWFEGRIHVQGDPIVAGRLVEMFGGAAPFHGLTQTSA